VGAGVGAHGRCIADGLDGGEPGDEAGVVGGAGLVGGGDVGDSAGEVGVDLGGAGDEKHLGHLEEAEHGVAAVEGRGRVLDAGLARGRVRVDAAGVAVAYDEDVGVQVAVLGEEELVVDAVLPVEHGEREGGEHADCLELDAVAVAVEVLEGGADGGEDSAFPWADVLGEDTRHNVDWVHVEVPADVFVLKTLAQLKVDGGETYLETALRQ